MKKILLAITAALMLTMPKAMVAQTNVETLWIENGERRIFGKLCKPDNADGKLPTVIVAHGFNGTHHFAKDYFKPLTDLGFQIYCFDFPCGSIHSQSDKNTMNMSIKDEVSDMKAIVNYFGKQPDADKKRIVLIGESQGGLVSALAAAEMPKAISQLVLIYPALCIPDNWNARYPRVEEIPDTTRLWNVPMGRKFFTEIRDLKPMELINKYKRPVLIVQGDKDRVVSMDDSRKAVELYRDARLHVIPGAGHGFKPKEREVAIEQITDFLKKKGNK